MATQFTLRSGTTGQTNGGSFNPNTSQTPTWVSGVLAGLAAGTSVDLVFDLGSNWTAIDGLAMTVRADLTGIATTSPAYRAFGSETSTRRADGTGRCQQMFTPTSNSGSLGAVGSNTSAGCVWIPCGRYFTVTIDATAATGTTFGAQSFIELTAFGVSLK